MSEIWKPIPDYPNYEASDAGRVRRATPAQSTRRNRVLTPTLVKGYCVVGLSHDGKTVLRKVHGLVAAAFIGPRPPGKEVSHLNGDRADNRLANLTYETPEENNRRKVQHGTHVAGEDHPRAKLTAKDVLEMRGLRALGTPLKDLSTRFGVDHTVVSLICRRKAWRHV